MIKYLNIGIFLLVYSQLFSQVKPEKKTNKIDTAYPLTAPYYGDKVYYKIIEDDPGKLKNLFITSGIAPGYVYSNLGLELGLDAKYQNENLLLFTNVAFTLLLGGVVNSNGLVMPVMHGEAGGTYFFKKSTLSKKVGIPLDSSSGLKVDGSPKLIERGIRIPANVLHKFGVRGGYFYRQNPLSKNTINNAEITINKTTAQNIFLGAGFFRGHSVNIEAKNWGSSNSAGFFHLYGDIIFAPAIDGVFSTIDANGNSEPLISHPYTKNHFGARIGFNYLNSSDKMHTSFGPEIGILPGFNNISNFYAILRYGWGFHL